MRSGSLGTFALAVALACSSGVEDEAQRFETLVAGPTMGTAFSVKVVTAEALPPETQASIRSRVESELNLVDRAMSTYRDDSEISALNAASQGEPVAISDATREVIELSLAISERSTGAFDVTVGPLVDLWGFGPAPRRDDLPSEAELARLLQEVGAENILVHPDGSVSKGTSALRVDLSAVAKGFAVDQVSRGLTALGYGNHLVEVGGETRASGINAAGIAWRVAIERPSGAIAGSGLAPRVQQVISLDHFSLATSGDYRNFYEQDGRRFSHTIDPRTGRPVEHSLASASVLAEDCATADALATALMVLGPEEGLDWADRQGVAASLLVYNATGGIDQFTTRTFDELTTRDGSVGQRDIP